MQDDDGYVDVVGIGQITHISDQGTDKPKHPLGFYVPEDTMTAYRERMKAGAYEPEKSKPAKRRTVKRATVKRGSSKK